MATVSTIAVFAVVLAGCRPSLPARTDPPPDGQAAEIGVAYAASVSCAIPIELGGRWWTWDEPIGKWPDDISIPPFPFSIWGSVSTPYAVPGIVTLTDADHAVFRADVDGSEFDLTGHDENPYPGDACL